MLEPAEDAVDAVEQAVDAGDAAAQLHQLAAGGRLVTVEEGVLAGAQLLAEMVDDVADVLRDRARQQVERRGAVGRGGAVADALADEVGRAHRVDAGGEKQPRRDGDADRADAHRVALAVVPLGEVALEVVDDAADGIALHHRALVRVGREQQLAHAGGQLWAVVDPVARALVDEVQVQPAVAAIGVPQLAVVDLARSLRAEGEAPDEAGPDAAAEPGECQFARHSV